MQSLSREEPGWMNHKLELRLSKEILITSDLHLMPLNGRKQRGTKKPLDGGERGQ